MIKVVSIEQLFSLFPHSNLLSSTPNLPLQNAATQLIRADVSLSSRYEVRMLMTEPGTNWSSSQPSGHIHAHAGGREDLQSIERGGYEIRPKYLPPDPGSAPLSTTSTIYIVSVKCCHRIFTIIFRLKSHLIYRRISLVISRPLLELLLSLRTSSPSSRARKFNGSPRHLHLPSPVSLW